jgi:hypothetical protein
MSSSSEWPNYTIGPRDSIFAMGVASTKFTELEVMLWFIFGTVFNLDMDGSTMIPAKIGNEATKDLIDRRLLKLGWGEPAKGHVEHFLEGFNICLENRNYLVHSGLAWTGSPSIVLLKTSKQGITQAAIPTLDELRAVADDIQAYTEYGRAVGNAINNNLSGHPVFPVSVFPWPHKPVLPRRLRYSSDPQPLR